MNKGKAINLKHLFSELSIIPITIVYFVIASIVVPFFFSGSNVLNILVQMSDMLIISLGMMVVVLNGGIDFSMTAVMGLGCILGAQVMNLNDGLLMDSPFGWIVGILIMVGVGLGIGCINGLAVVKLKMPSFMATMATYLSFGGLALFIANSNPINHLPEAFLFIGNGNVAGAIPFPVILAGVVAFVMYILLNRTVFGRNVYAIGTNPKAALVSGLPVKKNIFMLFIISGLLASLGAMISSARLGAAMPALNDDRLMDFVTAVILGGTSPFGGKGTVVGTVIGAFFIVMLNNSLGMMGLQWYVITMIKGIFLMAIILVDSLNRGKSA